MDKWNMVKLSDVFTLQMGKTPSRNNPDYWNGNHKWLSIADFGMNGKYINKTTIHNLNPNSQITQKAR